MPVFISPEDSARELLELRRAIPAHERDVADRRRHLEEDERKGELPEVIAANRLLLAEAQQTLKDLQARYTELTEYLLANDEGRT